MKLPSMLLWLAALCLSGCASGQSQPKLPYDAWSIGLLAPNYMEVWVESVDVIDRRGLVFERVHGGTVAMRSPVNNKGNPNWPSITQVGSGKSKAITGVDLPKTLYVRWQSLVEPQTYNVRINVPEWAREAMVTKKQPVCPWKSDWGKNLPSFGYSDHITIGLAPGGIAKVWLQGPCLDPIEIGRFEGVINKNGPYDGTSGGKHRPLSEASKAYIKEFGIPYGSW
ncbi:DUF2931 family protein [Pseudomonas benzenivorans]|uniref:DUF2931 family protein n=1 Tax=Pseudomonas benzenivorans TaxID=556533 RepID=A0ABY5H415_9PSED|nr:DUF2931 family protein [Pseudomonas benzenivorans]UTW05796.1 DUF2931 family protein [Pseudomonas benzenivorans]